MKKEKKLEFVGVIKALVIVVVLCFGIGLVGAYVANPTISDAHGWQWGDTTINLTGFHTTHTTMNDTGFYINSSNIQRQTATFIVAASDSLHKERADYVCDGVDDQVEIQVAIDALATLKGTVFLLEGTYNITAIITGRDYVNVRGSGFGTIWDISALSGGIDAYTLGQYSTFGHLKIIGTDTYGANDWVGISMANYSTIETLFIYQNTYGIRASALNLYVRNVLFEKIHGGQGWASCIHCNGNAHFVNIEGIYIDDADRGIEVEDGANDCYFANGYLNNVSGVSGSDFSLNVHSHAGQNPCKNIAFSHFTLNGCDGPSIFGLDANAQPQKVVLDDINVFTPTTFTRLGGYDISFINSKIDGEGGSLVTWHGIIETDVVAKKVLIDNCKFIAEDTNYAIVLEDGGGYITVSNCECDIGPTQTRSTIYIKNVTLAQIINNVFKGSTGGSPMIVGGNANIIGNILEHKSIYIYSAAPLVIMKDNRLPAKIDFEGSDEHKHIYADKYSDLFMDVLAVSATHVVNAQACHVDPATLTVGAGIAVQPDVPRTFSWVVNNTGGITAADITITGIDTKGNSITESFDLTGGLTGETNNAFATVSEVKIENQVNAAAGDTISVGITDVLGLSNIIYETGDIYKIKKNNTDAVVAAAQVSTTYDTYDMSVIGLVATNDFTVWYKSNLNIIS